jgi:flavodoxin
MKVLIAYDSRTGHTEEMAEYVAEGVRACQEYGRGVGEKLAK